MISQQLQQDPYGFENMVAPPPEGSKQQLSQQQLDNQRFALENQRMQIENASAWGGDDYMKILQGVGHLASGAGKAFQDIYLSTRVDSGNIRANLDLNRNDQMINQLLTQNQTLKARIDQTGAVPQVYAPSNTQAAPQQQGIKTSHVVAGVGAIVILGLFAVVLKK